MITDYKETIDTIIKPKVAASGMVTGGRILSYLERYISLPETTVIIVGTKQKELGKKITRRSQRSQDLWKVLSR
jgi:predicted metal-dependent RNase